MTQAQLGNTVQVHFTSRLDDGTILDSSDRGSPIVFTLGTDNIIPGIEQAVLGRQVGENKTVHIPAEQAHGMHHPDKVVTMPRQNLLVHLQPEVGQHLRLQRSGEQAIEVTVVEVTTLHVILDANHPLAGKDLTFEVTLIAIDEKSPDE